ncbi:hypothetical protein SCLCIDRAFT_1206976 [Scleroderma citrinum Foug A]|uniref:G domain-containing protein n=1 Tax=Scleroderma citrinum Foug A TaxID=1036808 RepID=A0A0C3ESL2_9AGAM|nr:hypothetical protein SCLCIDRAFT_1206976 [Scleroderma citrinum Foug A]
MDSMNADHVNRKDTRSAGSVVDPNTVEQSEETDKLKKVTDADVTPVIGNSPGSAAHLNGTTESRNEVCGASSMVTGQGQLLDEDKEDNSLDRLLHDDVIIAIMGPTGSGKSSFISRVTGNADGIGHTLTSCTSEVKVTKVEKLANVVLVDTPGFDDTNKSDLEILELISKWLNKTYRNKVYLSAIFYFHRITDNRMAGTPLKNLRVFKKLCGNNAMAQVFLVTTMWDEVEEDVGVERLNELKSTYWKGMVSRGSTVVEYRNTWDSATKLLDDATRRSSERRHVTLQKEISELKMELRETEAGQQLCSRLEDLADQRLQTLRKLREEQSKSGDPRSTEELRKEYTELRAQLDDTLKQVHALRLPLRKRAAAQLRKIFSHPRRK